MCQCKEGTICDPCASERIEAINTQLGDEATEIPLALAPSELAGMTSRVNKWLETLKTQAELRKGTT